MGTRGPKAQTKQQQDLKGNPSNRPRPDPVPSTGLVAMPLWLDVDAMGVFNRVVDAMPPKFYTAADTEILSAYAVACSTAKQAAIEVQERGIIIEEERWNKELRSFDIVLKKNPAQGAWAEAVSRIATLGTRLGLDPAARQAITMPGKPGEDDNNGFGDLIGGKPFSVVEGGKKT